VPPGQQEPFQVKGTARLSRKLHDQPLPLQEGLTVTSALHAVAEDRGAIGGETGEPLVVVVQDGKLPGPLVLEILNFDSSYTA